MVCILYLLRNESYNLKYKAGFQLWTFTTPVICYELAQILEPTSSGPDTECAWIVLFAILLGLYRKC